MTTPLTDLPREHSNVLRRLELLERHPVMVRALDEQRKRETISCGCCRGPVEDRCACWIHRYTTPVRLTITIDGRHVAHACSACAPPVLAGPLDIIEAREAEERRLIKLVDAVASFMVPEQG